MAGGSTTSITPSRPDVKTVLTHVLPSIGPVEVSVYGKAAVMLRFLSESQEKLRLQQLAQLGALCRCFPGARSVRWDYTVALLYFSEWLRVKGVRTGITLGTVRFSSTVEALQCLSLVWNVGHLPETFAAEKGLLRFLRQRNDDGLLSPLNWPKAPDGFDKVIEIKGQAEKYVLRNDYLGLSRALAALKLARSWDSCPDEIKPTIRDMAIPYLLGSGEEDLPWQNVQRFFALVRHLAYLSMAAPVAGLTWFSSILVYLSAKNKRDMDPQDLRETVCEICSPVERAVAKRIYHSTAARRVVAAVASQTFRYLIESREPIGDLVDWLLVRSALPFKLDPSVSTLPVELGPVNFRSHFVPILSGPSEIEGSLIEKGFKEPCVLVYRAWNSDVVLEPDEVTISAWAAESAEECRLGRLIVWMAQTLDNVRCDRKSTFDMLAKADLEPALFGLFKQALKALMPGYGLRLEPWPLKEMGFFGAYGLEPGGGRVWACAGDLGDNVAKYITRDRRRYVRGKRLLEAYEEVLGLRELRIRLRRQWRRKRPRQYCLLVTAGVRLGRDGNDALEFDGGILTISSRSGRMIWYGLETKRRGGDPRKSLEKRLNQCEIEATVELLTKRHAVAKVELR